MGLTNSLIDGDERLGVNDEVQGAYAIATVGVGECVNIRTAGAVTQEGIGLTNSLIDGAERDGVDGEVQGAYAIATICVGECIDVSTC